MILIFKDYHEKAAFMELLPDRAKNLVDAIYTYSHQSGDFDVEKYDWTHTAKLSELRPSDTARAEPSDLGEITHMLGIV